MLRPVDTESIEVVGFDPPDGIFHHLSMAPARNNECPASIREPTGLGYQVDAVVIAHLVGHRR